MAYVFTFIGGIFVGTFVGFYVASLFSVGKRAEPIIVTVDPPVWPPDPSDAP
jgi:hypothetical protein